MKIGFLYFVNNWIMCWEIHMFNNFVCHIFSSFAWFEKKNQLRVQIWIEFIANIVWCVFFLVRQFWKSYIIFII